MRVERIGDATIYTADVLGALREMADESVHCVMTSPPYWGLRDYGTGTWEGGSAKCDHRKIVRASTEHEKREGYSDAFRNGSASANHREEPAGREICPRCGARRTDQQLGLERLHDCLGWATGKPCGECYVCHIVAVFRAVRRVLRKDGTCWVNLGDSYNAYNGGAGPSSSLSRGAQTEERPDLPTGYGLRTKGLKPKDLCMMPARVALALQADGWYLRSDIIWAKPNPMPESVTDRPTKAHEYLFLLTRSPRYFYDAEAIKEPCESGPSDIRKMEEGLDRIGGKHKELIDPLSKASSTTHIGQKRSVGDPAGRNRRTVWTIATQPYPEAHFATFPEKLVEPCVLAGCPAQVCPECGAPWKRVVERINQSASIAGPKSTAKREQGLVTAFSGYADGSTAPSFRTLGFRPTCICAREDTVPGTFLDPFCGAGTALLVTLRLGRRAVGIELKPEYMALTRKRIAEEAAQGKLL